MKILIVQTAFIGDVILATALLEQLHRDFPQAQLDFLLRKGNESLLDGHPFINKVLIFDKKNKLKSGWQLLKAIRAQRYDWVLNLQRFFSAGLLTVLSGAKNKVGFDKNPLSWLFDMSVTHQLEPERHEVSRNAGLAAPIYAPEIGKVYEMQPAMPRLYPSPADFESLPKLENYVCFAPASIWATKQLPEHKWVELCGKIPADTAIVLIGAKSDVELCERIKTNSNRAEIINAAGKFSFMQSAALMSKAQMNYVNDSAPLHIASAMNAPVTAFFCSTVPSFGFGPLSERSEIKQVQGLGCRPCGLHGHKSCPQAHFRCGEIEL